MSVISEEELIPELGDRITIISKAYGTVTGRIVFRDETMIRVKPQVGLTDSRHVYDFPTNPDSGEFDPSLGVEQIQFHAKRSSPLFSKQLAVLADSDILLYTMDPTPEKARVVNVISTEDEDALIVRREGKDADERIDFDFRGPPVPILYIEPAISETEPEPFVPEPESEPLPELEAPGAVMEVANMDKTYSDQIQFEEIMTHLLSEIPVERHSSERILTILKRRAYILLSLKQAVQTKNYTATTLLEAITHSNEPLNAVLPVATIRRVLYLDDTPQETELYEIRNITEAFERMLSVDNANFDKTSDASGYRFAKYVGSILNAGSGITDGTLSTPNIAKRIVVDQEVFRAPSGAQTRGLVANLPPAYYKDTRSSKEIQKVKQRYIGPIVHQLYRLIGDITIKHPDTGQLIQLVKGNVLDPLEYLLLPSSLAQQRCATTRTGVLLWDVQQSEQVRYQSSFSSQVNEIEPMIIDPSLSLSDVLETRITRPFYNLSGSYIQSILDEIGLRQLEWTPDLIDTISTMLAKNQKDWMLTYDEQKKRVAIPKEMSPVLVSAVNATSPLLTSIDSSPLLQKISKQMKAKESSLKDIDLVLAEALLISTHRTIRPLWYAVAAGQSDVSYEQSIIQSELYRISVLEQRSAQKELSYHAEPIINTCKHVNELESIRSVENESERMKLIDLFHTKYEAGVKNNWIQCNVCHQDLLCRHELLLLQEYKKVINRSILHKALLIEFGDQQYGDHYVCKNCGIAIGEIEFDTNPEFDDDGNLMQGRSILTDKSTFSFENLDLVTVLQEEEIHKSKMDEDKEKIYNVIRVLFEYAGANPSDTIYNYCINSIYQQLVIMENQYKTRIASRLKSRTVDDSVIIATLLVILSTAFVITELQISEQALPIYITKQGCNFSRNGIPRDKEGTGLLDYVICILIEIDLNQFPWTDVIWQSYNGINRKNIIVQEVKYALSEISKLPTIADALHVARNRIEKEAEMTGTVPIFRPRTDNSSAITNATTFQQSLQTDPIQSIRQEVMIRTEALSQELIQQAHKSAVQTKEDLLGQSKRLDGQCERTKLTDLVQNGFGIVGKASTGTQQEIQLLRAATPILLRRDPSHSLGMSNFITPWGVYPPVPKSEQHIESLSFRLFMKACASGPNAGLPHEYGIDRICRRCGLQSPIEFLNLNVEEMYQEEQEAIEKPGKKLDEARESLQQIATKKDTILKEALEEIKIESDYDAFLVLQDKIHLRKEVRPIEVTPPIPWVTQITTIVQPIQSLYANWTLFQTFFQRTSDTNRIAAFVPISNLIPTYLRTITNQYITLVGRANQKESQKTITAFASHFETLITSITGTKVLDEVKSVRTLLTSFVNPLSRIANGVEFSVKGSRWIHKIKYEHELQLQDIWKRQYTVVDNAIQSIENHEDDVYKTTVSTALNRYTMMLGSLLEVIFNFVRISPSLNSSEYNDLVRWIVLGSISCLLDESSMCYDVEATTPFLRQTVAAFLGTTVFQLFASIHKESQLYNKTPEEIRFAIEARKQQERERFIKKQDKLTSDGEKRADNLMKLFGLGDYSKGALTKKFAYDADYFEFHRNQRLEYGLPDFSQDVTNLEDTLSPTLMIEEAGTFDEYIGANEQDD